MGAHRRVRTTTHVFGLEQFLAALVAVGMRRHFRVDAGVISAGQDGHGHSGVHGALQLVGHLSDLLVRASAKVDLGDVALAVFVLWPVLVDSTRALGAGFRSLETKKESLYVK